MIAALLACAPHDAPVPPGMELMPDTGDTGDTADTGRCPTDYIAAGIPSACDEPRPRGAEVYPLSDAALRVSVPNYPGQKSVLLTANIGGDDAADLVIAPEWHSADTYSIWILDASRRGAASVTDAWLTLEWNSQDHGYAWASVIYAPDFFPDDGLVAQVGLSPTSWYAFRAPLEPGLVLEDADLVVVGRASGRETAADDSEPPTATADLDGDGLSDLLFPARMAGEAAWGGTYEVATGRVYLVPGGSTGTLYLEDVPDWIGGGGFADCESWDVSAAEALGDVNGDGYGDVAVIGISSLPILGGESAAWIVHGPFSGGRTLSDETVRFDGESFYGDSMVSGDFDGDGTSDLAINDRTLVVDVGADGILDSAADGDSAAWVHYGPFEGVRQVTEGVGLLPTAEGEHVGVWMEANDFDGDGSDDLLTVGHGNPLSLTWGPFCETGAVTRDAVAFGFESDYPTPFAGIASGPDLDGDELPEAAVTAFGEGGDWSSAVYVVPSGDLMPGPSEP